MDEAKVREVRAALDKLECDIEAVRNAAQVSPGEAQEMFAALFANWQHQAGFAHTKCSTISADQIRGFDTMDEKANAMKFDPLLLDDRERDALREALYQLDSKDEVLLGIRDKLTVMIVEIATQPQRAAMDQMEANMALLKRQIDRL